MIDESPADEAPTDRQARADAAGIADRFLYAHQDLIRRRADSDGFWEPPGDLATFGDGSGLIAVVERQLLDPARSALHRAEAEIRALRERVAERDRRAGDPAQ